jgi:hypothetical protein
MKKTFTIFALLLLVLGSNLMASERPPYQHSFAKETGNAVANYTPVYGKLTDAVDPVGAVPGMSAFFDYVTNGNSIRDIVVLGDTIIVSWVLSDSTDPLGATTRKALYTVSYDGGSTWLASPVGLTPTERSAYPDINPVIDGTGRNVVITGRVYQGATQRGVAFVEAILGLGSITEKLTPAPGRDLFSYMQGGNIIGGTFQTGDTLNYIKFDVTASNFTGRQVLAVPGTNISASARAYIGANGNNNVSVMWWHNDIGGMLVKESTDGGNTFGSEINICPRGTLVNGDSVTSWFGADIIYKPGTTTRVAALNTLGFSGGAPNFGTITGYKLLFWSPGINGGNPVAIADRTNYPMLQDTAIFNNNFLGLQVGATAVSHPSLAYSDDGTRLFCVYSGVQPDTLDGFNFNDIYVSYSDNDGATWSAPRNLTNTPNVDEMYASISKRGNTSEKINIVFQSTMGPGSQSFTDNAPTYRVWQVFRKYNPTNGQIISVKNISNEVPSSFSLKQNYPNPFNPTTSIRFEIARSSEITLKVYDINGKEVATLVNNEQVTPGLKEVTFDATKLSSGIYFYTLQAADFKETKKMMLVK